MRLSLNCVILMSLLFENWRSGFVAINEFVIKVSTAQGIQYYLIHDA